MVDLERTQNLKGWAFPFRFSESTGGVAGNRALSQEDEIEFFRASIMIILGTELGSRVMRRNFGSRLASLTFLPIDDSLRLFILDSVQRAITRWEPGVELGPIDIIGQTDNPLRIDIGIPFRVRRSRQAGETVFSFFPQGA